MITVLFLLSSHTNRFIGSFIRRKNEILQLLFVGILTLVFIFLCFCVALSRYVL